MRADRQAAGRGRRGNAWVSPPGNLYATLVLPLTGPLRADDPAAYGFAGALAVRDACVAAGAPGDAVRLKWPNDVLLRGAKLSGLLIERVERAGGRGAEAALLVGIGVNLARAPAVEAYETTALSDAATPPTPAAFLGRLDAALSARLAQRDREGLAGLRRDWLACATGLGGPATVRLPGGAVLRGVAEGVDARGGLALRVGAELRTVTAGDVFFPASPR